MYTEELTEEGIVKESKDGIATIVISDSESCKECTAKLYCKPGNSNERSLIVKDTFGVNTGDKVRISIRGSQILRVSFLIYGIPLILMLAGLFLGMQFFQIHKELYSTIFAVGLVSIYILIIHFIDKKRNSHLQSYPEIVFVSDRKL
ncbi:MAG: SoxR reducing system RseC family protein [Ignavibacterium sp.]|nr:SoxR reducing system RseC family protein [Ignavibacterium sp.]